MRIDWPAENPSVPCAARRCTGTLETRSAFSAANAVHELTIGGDWVYWLEGNSVKYATIAGSSFGTAATPCGAPLSPTAVDPPPSTVPIPGKLSLVNLGLAAFELATCQALCYPIRTRLLRMNRVPATNKSST